MSELDLTEIRKLMDQPHNFHLTRAADLLFAEAEKLRAENARLERLLGADPFPTSDGYEQMAAALTDLRGLVIEILRHFPQIDDPDLRDSVRSGNVPTVTVARWRRIAEAGGSDE